MKSKFFGHNFATVFRFEVVRMLKKKSFWASVLAFPILMAGLFALVFWAEDQGVNTIKELAKQEFSIGIIDRGKILPANIVENISAREIPDKESGITEVKSGKLDAFFYFPTNLTENEVQIFAKNVGVIDNGKYQDVAQNLLQASAVAETNPEFAAILMGQVKFSVETFRDGKPYNPIMEMIAPGIFLVLFYTIIAMFGAQMMNATVEEKENRVMEMLLVTIKSRTLIIGKIFAMITLILIQIVVIIGLVLIAYFALGSRLNLPSIDLGQIPFDPIRILAGAAIFLSAILLFSGILVGIGAAVPTAKEANQFMAVPLILIFAPLYILPLVLTSTVTPAVNFMTFFPFTAPVMLLLRNAIGNLSVWETIFGIAIMATSAIIVFFIAARLFQTGAVEYSKRMSLKGLFRKR
ncbi:ABC transporter permease [Candidatus Saccharibacteria bacterium]|nr:ABC transporter permease [Candidatus Saccharibacteria bacterium]MCL1963133.1 ABC transporter permease [Candidatus Saccharibacteria bacterium]MCL1963348.1 ABC transporter permease [Candidatus Saccharibacteria bacterium]